MDWKDFKKRFGVNTTSNFDLLIIAKKLKLKIKVLMRDELSSESKTGMFVINIQPSTEEGAHWTAVYSTNKEVYFFDSYALPPVREILAHFNHTKNRFMGDKNEQFQTFEKFCGEACMYFLFKLNQNPSLENFKSVLNEFNSL